MACKEENLAPLIEGGILIIYFNDEELHRIPVSAPSLGGENNADSTITTL